MVVSEATREQATPIRDARELITQSAQGADMVQRRPRRDKPSRYRKAKSNSSIATVQRTLEAKFGLPEGSVKLVYPSGRKARTDSSVGALRTHWDNNG